MKLEDLQSLKLDVEILNQEKSLQENQIVSLTKQLEQSQSATVTKHQQLVAA